MADLIEIEVAYAEAHKQKVVRLQVEQGTSIQEAALQSGLEDEFAGLDISSAKLGVFGKAVPKPETVVVAAGDRIEIYRPLIIDPKQARLNRAAKKD